MQESPTVSTEAVDNVSVQMIRDLRGVIEREKAEIGVFLTLTPPKATMTAGGRGGGAIHEMEGFAPVPRLQIVTIEEALALRDRAVKLPARRDDVFKRAAREEAPERQGRLELYGRPSARFKVNRPRSPQRHAYAP